MTRFAVTGATGLVGENLVFEILKRHLTNLDAIEVLCLGRSGPDGTLAERLRHNLRAQGWQYLEVDRDDPILDDALAALVPVEYDLRRDDLGLSAEARALLAAGDIDHFFHVAALTDFRHKPHVAERLAEVNARGSERLLDVASGLSLGSFTFVSSAYSCGLTYGDIAPDTLDFNRPFQNPYQHSKLVAERAVREFFAGRDTRLRVFRPSTISGRRIEQPTGYVNKYDVYLGWGSYFVKCKIDGSAGASWDDILARPMEIPVRVHTNTAVGLNIVPADFAAKLMLSAAVSNHDAESYHLVSRRDLPNGVMLGRILERINVSGWSFTPDPVEPGNDFERGYYATVGALYTPYISGPAAQAFDATTMLELCRDSGIAPIGIETQEDLDLMLDFAIRTRFGFQLDT